MLKKSLYVLSVASLLSASTTMCYKKDHLDPSTIETIALDGGKCAGKLSVTQMKKDGYKIDSMKLQNGTDGLNYIYIFEKKSVKTEAIGTAILTDAQLTDRIEKIQKTKELQKVAKTEASAFEDGKKLYESTCKRCHGDGTIRAYNTARPLKELSLEDMELSIQDYKNGTKDNGMAMLMRPYASIVTEEETKGIFEYLKTLK